MRKLGFIALIITLFGCQNDNDNGWAIRVNGSVLDMEQIPQKNIPVEIYAAEFVNNPYAFIQYVELDDLELEKIGQTQSGANGKFDVISNFQVDNKNIYARVNDSKSIGYDSTKASLEIHGIKALANEESFANATYELRDVFLEDVVDYTLNIHRTQNITDTLYFGISHGGIKKLVTAAVPNSFGRKGVVSGSLRLIPSDTSMSVEARMLESDTLRLDYRLGNGESTSLKIVATRENDNYDFEF